ncbi:peroxiredoxin family protein [Paenibacillus filicis]|uniref:Peroxiredoxin family protein n=1 Tax=Paenibacillus gyeongsangnamensis TaxID=3388067 RepID=A0ABT4QA20_9BACL|nr:peroxiredoxin family protein [Paenibacillus filicis]MCZ8513688.1 peroxiredoxin family protein [Paenibacillus filicis]
MDTKKVVVFAMHDELESAYPPLNISIGAASTDADVILAFSRNGINILDKNYIPTPSKGKEYLANALDDFKATSISDLLSIAVNLRVRFVVPDIDVPESRIVSELPFEKVPLKWLLNEAATADLFVHF